MALPDLSKRSVTGHDQLSLHEKVIGRTQDVPVRAGRDDMVAGSAMASEQQKFGGRDIRGRGEDLGGGRQREDGGGPMIEVPSSNKTAVSEDPSKTNGNNPEEDGGVDIFPMFSEILKQYPSAFGVAPVGGPNTDGEDDSSSDDEDELEPCPIFLEALKKQDHMEDVLNNISRGHSR